MEVSGSHSNFPCVTSPPGGIYSSLPTFPAFHLLRSYNYLMTPRANTSDFLCKPQIVQARTHPNLLEEFRGRESPKVAAPTVANYPHYNAMLTPERLVPKSTCGMVLNPSFRKQRGEKKPIPEEQKDERYYERRRRNNQAAKKSRDARKQREDQIALRATLLEHENALLKAQLLTVREEATSLRQLLLEKKSIEFSLK